MRCVLLSDTHNRQWENKLIIPDGDVLVHSGDLTIQGTVGELLSVANWFDTLRNKFSAIIFTPGNHDRLFEEDFSRVMKFFTKMDNVHCLINQEVIIDGMKFWGTPVTRRFCDWAFNIDPDKLKPYWDMIPPDTDVLVTHQPPYGIGDFVTHVDAPGIPRKKNKEHLGCPDLMKAVERIQPRLHVYGHIHEGAGQRRCGRTTMVNAAILDGRYMLTHEPTIVDI